jgi:hypothetical protein
MASSAIAVVRFQPGCPLEGIDGGRVTEEIGLPLAGVATNEAIEIIEAHPDRPLIKRPGLARLIKRRVVVLAEPRGRVSVTLKDGSDGAGILTNDRIVPRKSSCSLTHNPEAGDVMVASGDQRGAGG